MEKRTITWMLKGLFWITFLWMIYLFVQFGLHDDRIYWIVLIYSILGFLTTGLLLTLDTHVTEQKNHLFYFKKRQDNEILELKQRLDALEQEKK